MDVRTVVWDALNAPLFTIGVQAVTPLSLLVLVVILTTTWVIAGRVRWFFERRIARIAGLDVGTQHLLGALLRYLLLLVGFYVGFRSLGFELDALLVALGALGVGIGFGLQNVANNFVSGLIVLTERPIRVGDVIEVNGLVGTVERVGIRATVVRKFDQTQVIVPNADLIASAVTNWTLDDRRVRLDLEVGVAYGSDVRLVERTLHEVVRSHPKVLPDPPPNVFFRSFGDSALNFWLVAHVADVQERLTTSSDLHFAIDAAFRKAGIEIPFPQRDLHLRGVIPSGSLNLGATGGA